MTQKYTLALILMMYWIWRDGLGITNLKTRCIFQGIREPGCRVNKIYNSCGAFKCDKFERTKFSIEQEQRDELKQRYQEIDEKKRRKEESELLADLFKSFF